MTAMINIPKVPNKITFGTVFITNIVNPFDAINSTVKSVDLHGRKLKDYLPNGDYVVSVDGNITTDFEQIVPQNTTIIISPYIGKSGGGKNILRTIAMIAVMTLATPVANSLFSGLSATAQASLGNIGYFALRAGVAAAGSLLVNAVLPPSMPNEEIAYSPESESPTYNWTGMTTTRTIGGVIPILYGTHALTGTVINEFVDYNGQDEYLHTQLALCMGEIEPISEADITIDNRAFGEFQGLDDELTAKLQHRVGTFDQSIMSGFDDSSYNNIPNAKCEYNEETIVQTVSTSLDKLKLHIAFASGLYNVNTATGALENYSVDFEIKYRKVGDEEWINLNEEKYGYDYVYSYRASAFAPLSYITEDEYKGNSFVYKWVDNGDGGSYPIYATYSHKIIDEDEEYISNSLNITGATRNALKRIYEVDNLTPAQYEVSVKRLTNEEDADSTTSNSDMYLSVVEEINTTDINYGGIALVGVDVKATDQLSGSSPNYKIMAKRKDLILKDKDGVEFTANSSNPAWVVYDILTNKVYGYRKNINNIDYDSFLEWANFCDTISDDFKLEFNGIIDSQSNIWDTIQMVAKIGRGQVILRGSKYSCIFDAPAQITQLFTDSNINENSLSISYIGVNDIASEVEISFANKELDYEMDKITVIDNELYSSQLSPNKTQVTMKGITSSIEALAMGRYLLANNKYIKRTAQWSANIDAIACTVGDVVGLSADAISYGIGGFILDKTDTTVKLDIEMNFVKDLIYNLRIKSKDTDEIVIYEFSFDTDIVTDTINVDGTNINTDDIYSINEKTNDMLLFRITEISRDSDFNRTIKAVEYNESILDFNYNNDIVQTILPFQKTKVELSNLTISDEIALNKDGNVITNLEFGWDVNFYDNQTFKIQYKRVGDTIWHLLQDNIQTTSTKISDTSLIDGNTYDFKVMIDDYTSTITTYRILGKTIPPANVENFLSEENRLIWSKNSELDLKGYKIRYYYGIGRSWNDGVDLFEGVITENYYDGVLPNVAGTYTLMIKAVDTSNNYSPSPTIITKNVGDVTINNLIETYDFSSWNGIKTNCEIVDTNLEANGQNSLIYDLSDDDLFYDKPESNIFYDANYETMSYEDEFTARVNGKAILNYSGTDGAKFYYKKMFTKKLYNDKNLMYYKDDNELFYDEGEYTPYLDGIDVDFSDRTKIKVEYPQTIAQTTMSDLNIKIDAIDYFEKIDDFIVSVGGSTYQSNVIDIVKNVQATLQGGDGVIFQYSKNNNEVTMNIYDIDGNNVGGICDISLVGYKI